MSQRITEAFLNAQIKSLNKLTDSPTQCYQNGAAQIGNYHLYQAYGAYQLHRFTSIGGGIEDVFRAGFMSKRELSENISAFMTGYSAGKEITKIKLGETK